MTIVRELLTVIGFPVDDEGAEKADKTFKGLWEQATKFSFGFNQAFDAINKGISVISGGINTIVDAPQKLISIAESSAALGDRVAKTGRQLGLTAEEMQRLEFAADRSGLAATEVRQAIQKLGKNAADAASGLKGPIENFKRLGVNVRNSDGSLKSINELLPEVADAVKSIEDPAERAAVSMRVMGGTGAQMLPLLLEGSKGIDALNKRADELGFVMSNEAAAASEHFIDQLTDMRRALLGASTQIGTKLFPSLGDLVDRFTALIVRSGVVNKVLPVLAEGLISVFSAALSGLETIQKYSGFLKIMALILGTVASVIFVQLIPAMYAYITSLNLVTIAQLKAVAIPALMIAGFVALAAVIALVIEDIHNFVAGGESAIGNLLKAFNDSPQDPNEHWAVQILRFIVTTAGAAIEAVDLFFKGFFEDAERLGGISEAIAGLFDVAIEGWKNAILGAFDFILEKAKGLASGLSRLPLVGRIFEGEITTSPLPTSPSSAPPPPSAGFGVQPRGGNQTQVSNTVQGGTTTVNVYAGEGGTPGSIATAASESLVDVMDRDRRETLRSLDAASRSLR